MLLNGAMLSMLASSTAVSMLIFLDKLKARCATADAILKAGKIIVRQFK